MAPSPDVLRAAAEVLRSSARRVEADVRPVVERCDRRTWEGPAADRYRAAAATVRERVEIAAIELRYVADQLDLRAVQLAAEADVVARAEAARQWRADGRRAVEEALRWPEDTPAPPPPPPSAPWVSPSTGAPAGGPRG